jgi:signal transduction histidine kinase
VTRQSGDEGLDMPRTSDATARALVAAIPDPIFRIGLDGRYRGFKVDSLDDLLTPPDEVIGRTVHERLPVEVADLLLAAGRSAVEKGTPQHIEYALEVAGEQREYEGRVVACDDDEFMLIVRDFTERARQEEELRRSRARLVSASDAERKRLERNLHDGAQQNLVTVSHAVHLGLRFLRDDPEKAESHLQRALAELNTAHEELRELARGLHPEILTRQGLSPAVRSLAGRAPIPVTVVTVDDGTRWPPLIESAAYYVVAEALTNVAKYAKASTATVRVVRERDRLCIEVADDGCGGAAATPGSGLGGLADRVEALDGRLEVESPPGRGTRVRAELPLPGER